ncbi:MAG: 30S ribosomal protein S7 [Proteobacteria bacterium]|nr:30S ribosomal protein S7 [Pseudomonadota bacterium]
MPRRKAAPRREILPDPLFHSIILAKFINTVMRNGKKSIAEKIVYGALDHVVKSVGHLSDGDGEGGGDRGGDQGGSGGRKLAASANIRNSDEARSAALKAFRKALDNVTPLVEVKSRRVGGSTYQVPVEIRETRRVALAMRWLVEFAGQRSQKGMMMRLAQEILDAIGGRGGAVKKRDDVHRMAKANQAFAHYRW